MQCSPPFYSTGFPNNFGQYCPCNCAFPPSQPFYPEIIGEGEVASVVFPDGSVHMYFVPFSKRFLPPFTGNYASHCNNNTMGAFYVKGIYPMSPALFNQQCQKIHSSLSPQSRSCYIPDCNSNLPLPGFNLQFHNDGCTSTSDLQYFVPRVRRTDCLPLTQLKECVSVQVDIPVKETQGCHREPETRASRRRSNEKISECESADECYCMKYIRSANSVVYKHKQESKRSRGSKQKRKPGKRRSDVVCECGVRTDDKAMTTVADAGNACAGSERDTQTPRDVTCGARRDVTPELWLPRTSLARAMSQSCEKLVGRCERRSSDQCCCSDAERSSN